MVFMSVKKLGCLFLKLRFTFSGEIGEASELKFESPIKATPRPIFLSQSLLFVCISYFSKMVFKVLICYGWEFWNLFF